ncbi:hypothetical protein [Croceicoccus sp. YJ47]|uniref:hypothetical protein n=1 Tax=Croceicoccus sp. YJ47 TaxID=2798724 RepID=UPI001921C2D3|nr:hypothetical protein [Croceicoccus sp. YJ47]QQN73039.1 hypothetical protein JD971_09040 [Croceicoccus sp. YJ47]
MNDAPVSHGEKPEAEPRPDTLSREERLAAQLRANLRRRKAQSRAIDASKPQTPPD